jgi:hypothetical protein
LAFRRFTVLKTGTAGDDGQSLDTDIRVLEADGGDYMGFIKLVGRRR